MTVLADTSVWVEYFRGRPEARELDTLLARNEVVICGPVVAELLAGTAAEQVEVLWLAVGSLPSAPMDDAVWREAGKCAGELHRRGETVPLLDVVIAVTAVRSAAAVWTRDRDFARIGGVLPALRLHEAP